MSDRALLEKAAGAADAALLQVVSMLACDGITMSINKTDDGLTAWFEDGFYKSDGMARLQTKDGRLYLHSRYNQVDEINSIDDIINVSFEWYEFSKDRFDGWRTPPTHWQRLYARAAAAIHDAKGQHDQN